MKKMVMVVLAVCVMVCLSGYPAMAADGAAPLDNLLKSSQETWAYILGIAGAVLVIGGNPGAFETGSEVGVVLTWLLGIIGLVAAYLLGFS